MHMRVCLCESVCMCGMCVCECVQACDVGSRIVRQQNRNWYPIVLVPLPLANTVMINPGMETWMWLCKTKCVEHVCVQVSVWQPVVMEATLGYHIVMCSPVHPPQLLRHRRAASGRGTCHHLLTLVYMVEPVNMLLWGGDATLEHWTERAVGRGGWEGSTAFVCVCVGVCVCACAREEGVLTGNRNA